MLIYLLGGVSALAVLFVAFWWAAAFFAERPEHRLVRQDGAFELRDYPALLAAEVTKPGARGAAVRAGFGPLAGYIFAREREGPSIAMTAPVTQLPAESGAWRVRFIMPKRYSLEELPQPVSGDVALVEIPARRMAVIRFSGAWSDERFAQKAKALIAWMTAQGFKAAGPPVFAYYNDPMTPGFLRRNEVLVEVVGG
ncbi:MAG: heme-binding protein [Pseudomonadota bacterium]